MRIGIIGAGMAGLSCATRLAAGGHEVVLVDKGRGPGGRMSTRRLATPLGEVAFDHGAQYLTARDPAFMAEVERWAEGGHVARWPVAGADAWVGTPGMSAPIGAMALPLDVRWQHRVDRIERGPDGWAFHGEGVEIASLDGAVVAVPAEQVVPLVEAHRPDWAGAAAAVRSDPCWTLMAAYDARLPIGPDRVTDRGIIGSAVRNSAKPWRGGVEAWVVQASGDWSARHLEEEAEVVARALLAGFVALGEAALPAPVATSVHRWRFAKSGKLGRDALWDGADRIGACGDWLLGGRVEAAWLSGRRLADRVIAG